MRASEYVRRALRLPVRLALYRAAALGARALLATAGRRSDFRRGTYGPALISGRLLRLFPGVKVEWLEAQREQYEGLAQRYLAHYFDLLGSGWVNVRHGIRCRGLEGHRYDVEPSVEPDADGRWLSERIDPANLAEARRIWRLIDQPYTPIDWHLDFKSGFRWCERTWYLDIKYGRLPGVDVKVPWELARMQHLPQLALAYALAKTGQALAPPEAHMREFRNQVLDFTATNPPRFGVNWRCTMDVAIRVVNWLVAYDLFRARGAQFDAGFEQELVRSVWEHGRHIVANLEWDPWLRGNHYLANIVGLLFVAAYLPRTSDTDAWLAYSVQELVNEVERQFGADGTNFEASTCYHRLSAEMVVYATAIVLRLPSEKAAALREYDHRLMRFRRRLRAAPLSLYRAPGADLLTPFPRWYFERLEKMAEFTEHVTKPNGHVSQVGDNDSGRFLKLEAIHRRTSVAEAKGRYANLEGYRELSDEDTYWEEDHLDHGHLVGAIGALFDATCSDTATPRIDPEVVGALARGVRVASYRRPGEQSAAERVRIGSENDWEGLRCRLASQPGLRLERREIQVDGESLLENLRLYAYPCFGLYLFKSTRLYLAVRCGPVGQSGNGGHAHNDQLAVELTVDGEDCIVDPGTYVYTPLPHRRNEYRSVGAHFAPESDGREPSRLDIGLFCLGGLPRVECLYFGRHGFLGRHRGYGYTVWRAVELTRNALLVGDYAEGTKTSVPNGRPKSVNPPSGPPISPGYGLVLRS